MAISKFDEAGGGLGRVAQVFRRGIQPQIMGAPEPALSAAEESLRLETRDSKNLNHSLPDPTPTKLPAENPDTPGSAQNPCRRNQS